MTPSLRFALGVLRVEACLIPESVACAAQPVLRTGDGEGCKGCVSVEAARRTLYGLEFSLFSILSINFDPRVESVSLSASSSLSRPKARGESPPRPTLPRQAGLRHF